MILRFPTSQRYGHSLDSQCLSLLQPICDMSCRQSDVFSPRPAAFLPRGLALWSFGRILSQEGDLLVPCRWMQMRSRPAQACACSLAQGKRRGSLLGARWWDHSGVGYDRAGG